MLIKEFTPIRNPANKGVHPYLRLAIPHHRIPTNRGVHPYSRPTKPVKEFTSTGNNRGVHLYYYIPSSFVFLNCYCDRPIFSFYSFRNCLLRTASIYNLRSRLLPALTRVAISQLDSWLKCSFEYMQNVLQRT